jgi:hypothetical protein
MKVVEYCLTTTNAIANFVATYNLNRDQKIASPIVHFPNRMGNLKAKLADTNSGAELIVKL